MNNGVNLSWKTGIFRYVEWGADLLWIGLGGRGITLTSDEMQSLPEVRFFGGVVVVRGVHAHTAVLQPVRSRDASALELQRAHPDLTVQLQHHQTGQRLAAAVNRVTRAHQLQRKTSYRLQRHFFKKNNNCSLI